MPSNPYRPSYRICASLPQAHLSGSSPRVTGACPHRLAYTTSPAKMTAATIVIAHSCPRVIRRKVKESRASVSSAYVRPVGVLSGLSSTRDGNGCGHSTGQFDNVPVHGVFDGD